MADPDRLELAREYDGLSGVDPVGMSLGWWAGRGDWANTTQESRDNAGHTAITDLDAKIAALVAFRAKLGAAVTKQGNRHG